MKQKKEIDIEVIEQLLKSRTSNAMMFQSFSIFCPDKKNYSGFIIIIVCLIPSILIGISLNTIPIIKTAIETINQVILSLLGIVFTGYAFFQALINKELLLWMFESDGKINKDKDKVKKSRLQISNEYFVKIMMLQSLSIVMGLLLEVSLSAFPEDWYLFNNYLINNLIAILLIWIYLSFNFLIVWETKSFIFNLYQLFNAYSVATLLSMADDCDDKNEKNEKNDN